MRRREMLETLRAASRGVSASPGQRSTAPGIGSWLYDRLHSRTASTVLRLFELVGIPLALVALGITVYEAQQSSEQTRLALAAAQEQLAESARLTMFDTEVDINERLRSLRTFVSIRSEAYPPPLKCTPSSCEPIRRLILVGNRPDGTIVYDLDLSGRVVEDTVIGHVILADANFTGAKLGQGPYFESVTFSRGTLTPEIFKLSADLIDVTIWANSLVGMDLSGADLSDVRFDDTDVSGVILCKPVENAGTATQCAGIDTENTFAGAFFDLDNPPVGIEAYRRPILFGGYCREPELGNGLEYVLAFPCRPDHDGEGDPGVRGPIYFPNRPAP